MGTLNLTFDDGPDPRVDARGARRAGARAGARATFFVLGARAAAPPGARARGSLDEGHAVGLHGHEPRPPLRARRAREGAARHRPRAARRSAALGVAPAALADPVGRRGGVDARRSRPSAAWRSCDWNADTHDWRGDAARGDARRGRPAARATARSCSPTTGSAPARCRDGCAETVALDRAARRRRRARAASSREPLHVTAAGDPTRAPSASRAARSRGVAAGAPTRDRDAVRRLPRGRDRRARARRGALRATAARRAALRRPPSELALLRRGGARPTRAVAPDPRRPPQRRRAARACRRRRRCATRARRRSRAGRLRAGVWGADPRPGEGEPRALPRRRRATRRQDVLLGRGRPAARARARPPTAPGRRSPHGSTSPRRARRGRPRLVPRARACAPRRATASCSTARRCSRCSAARRAARAAVVRARRGAHRGDVGGRRRRRRRRRARTPRRRGRDRATSRRSPPAACAPRARRSTCGSTHAAARARRRRHDRRAAVGRARARRDRRRRPRDARRGRARARLAAARDRRGARPRAARPASCSCSSTASSRSSRAPARVGAGGAAMTSTRRFEARYRGRAGPVAATRPSPYEQAKYDATLEAAAPGPFAARCELGAVDRRAHRRGSPPRCARAARARRRADRGGGRARARLAPWPHVEVARRDAPRATCPPAPSTSIVASEVLYYLDAARARRARSRGSTGALTPGGRLVAVHWTADRAGPAADAPPRSTPRSRAALAAPRRRRDARRAIASTSLERRDERAALCSSSAAGPPRSPPPRAYREAGRRRAPWSIVADEGRAPYERPPLDQGAAARRDRARRAAARGRPASGRARRSSCVTAAAVALDPRARTRHARRRRDAAPTSTCVLATGAAPCACRSPAPTDPGVHVLRTLDHALDAARPRAAPARSVVVVGSGFIGCEIAASLRAARLRGHARQPRSRRRSAARSATRSRARHRRVAATRHGVDAAARRALDAHRPRRAPC